MRRQLFSIVCAAMLSACGACDDGGGGDHERDSHVSNDATTDSQLDSHDMGVDEEMSLPTDRDFTPPSVLGRHDVQILATQQVVPAMGLSDEAETYAVNDDLDVVRHSGRVFFAWRTAHDHAPDATALIHVASSPDGASWQLETSLDASGGRRLPRLLPVGDTLFLYASAFHPLSGHPIDVLWSMREGPSAWLTFESLRRPQTALFRTKRHGDVSYLSYWTEPTTPGPATVSFDFTVDGTRWLPVDRAHVPVLTGGSRSDFAFDAAGGLVAVSTNEHGDDDDFGSKVCRAASTSIADWTCHPDPRLFDSPRLFWFDGETYLLARRHLTPSGHYDLGRDDLDVEERRELYRTEYGAARKRCALWRLDPTNDAIVFVADIPSRGDTCATAVLLEDEPGIVAVYNTSSPLDTTEDPTWLEARDGEVRVYRTVLRFDPR